MSTPVRRPEMPLRIITAEDVHASVQRALRGLEKAAEEIVWQIEMEAWRTLGYPSWSAMREAEYGGAAVMLPTGSRPDVTARLKAIPIGTTARGAEKHLTDQEIAETLGVSRRQVQDDLTGNNEKRSSAQNVEPLTDDVIDAELVEDYAPPVAIHASTIECSSCTQDFDPDVITEMDAETLLCPQCLDDVEGEGAVSPIGDAAGLSAKDSVAASEPEPVAPKPQRQKPITDQARDAGWDLRKAVERVERVAADKRFTVQVAKMTPQMRGHLTDAITSCQAVLDRINSLQGE